MIKNAGTLIIAGWLSATLMTSSPTIADQTPTSQPDPTLISLLKQTIEQSDSFEDKFDAEVWLFSKSSQLERYIPDNETRLNLLRRIHRAATRADLSPEVVLAVIQIESRFDPYALSYAGAQGLMQVMPFWKNEIGHPEDNLIDVETNLRYGCTILKFYLDKEKGHLSYALARYNGSYGKSWYPEKVMVAWDYWR
jgi:soluble lytic murein transglycosylase-like protein|tara:strand:+ start:9385 stop:9969 length:585 start_codon:yes stop_codon:yes gene_type:complete